MGFLLALTVGALGGTYLYRDINKTNIELKKEKKEFDKNFKQVLDSTNDKVENNLGQRFEVLDYIKTDYGCDVIFSLPASLTLKDFHKILPKLESYLNANIVAELSTTNNSIYSRIHYNDRKIDELMEIKIKWYQLMFNNSGSNDSKYRNKKYETFMIKKITEEKYGYKLVINVPIGLDHDVILSDLKSISNTFQCNYWAEYNREKSEIILTIIKYEIPDNYPYTPFKTKVNEFYIGMTYDYQRVIADLENYPHVMYSGMTRMGKTIAMLMAITNLIYYYNPSEVEFYLCQISEKQDLQIFKNVEHCKYYARKVEDVYKVLKYLTNEMDKRNRAMFEGRDYIENVYKWNKKHPNNKFSEIYFVGDEFALYQPSANDDGNIKGLKKKCLAMMLSILQQGGSAGIHLVCSLQRPSKDSFDAPMKAQIGTKICFKQPNSASSLVVLDDGTATELKKREAYIENDKRYLMKTLYLDVKMIKKYIKKWELEKGKYLNLDDNGNIVNTINQNKNTYINLNEHIQVTDNYNKNISTSINMVTIPKKNRNDKQKERRKQYLEKKQVI